MSTRMRAVDEYNAAQLAAADEATRKRKRDQRQCTLEGSWGVQAVREPVTQLERRPQQARAQQAQEQQHQRQEPTAVTAVVDAMPGEVVCVDLFCGCGGWSTGAAQAGHRIVLAIDTDPAALSVHRQNHKGCTHVRMKLGSGTEERLRELIRRHHPDGTRLHVHGSPPCQAFSAMRNLTKGRCSDTGMELVEWYIGFVKSLRPDSWSFEQVCMPRVREYLTEQDVCFHEFNFEEYGVPQTRRRTLGGTPSLIEDMKTNPAHKTDARTAPSTVLRTMPTRARYVRASGGKKPPASQTVRTADGGWHNPEARWARSVDEPTWTLLCACKPVWLCARYRTIRVFTRREICTIQTFPPDYKIRCDEADAVRIIGNCVPPLIARKLMSSLRLPEVDGEEGGEGRN